MWVTLPEAAVCEAKATERWKTASSLICFHEESQVSWTSAIKLLQAKTGNCQSDSATAPGALIPAVSCRNGDPLQAVSKDKFCMLKVTVSHEKDIYSASTTSDIGMSFLCLF